jgi:hypothetical protein
MPQKVEANFSIAGTECFTSVYTWLIGSPGFVPLAFHLSPPSHQHYDSFIHSVIACGGGGPSPPGPPQTELFQIHHLSDHIGVSCHRHVHVVGQKSVVVSHLLLLAFVVDKEPPHFPFFYLYPPANCSIKPFPNGKVESGLDRDGHTMPPKACLAFELAVQGHH